MTGGWGPRDSFEAPIPRPSLRALCSYITLSVSRSRPLACANLIKQSRAERVKTAGPVRLPTKVRITHPRVV